jgi:hypothetical protein
MQILAAKSGRLGDVEAVLSPFPKRPYSSAAYVCVKIHVFGNMGQISLSSTNIPFAFSS